MNSFTIREKTILAGLFFSKFDKVGLGLFGFSGFTEAFNIIGLALGVQPASIKNYRDEFDPFFENKRKGWHKRPIRDYCKKILEDFGGLPVENFTSLLKQLIYKEHDLDVLMEEVSEPNEDKLGAFAKRLLTGQAAEQYFLDVYRNIPSFIGLEIKDTTRLGCGFDFKLYSPHVTYAVEVKGLNDATGNVMLTDKEHTVASKMRNQYFLFVVKNFKKQPLHDLYKNPLGGCLVFNKIEQHIIQRNWTTRL